VRDSYERGNPVGLRVEGLNLDVDVEAVPEELQRLLVLPLHRRAVCEVQCVRKLQILVDPPKRRGS